MTSPSARSHFPQILGLIHFQFGCNRRKNEKILAAVSWSLLSLFIGIPSVKLATEEIWISAAIYLFFFHCFHGYFCFSGIFFLKNRIKENLDRVSTMKQRDQSFTSVYPRPTTEYVWLAGRPIAALKSNENANGTYSAPTITYLFSGHLNEVLLETDSEGEFLYAHKYEPFGKQNLFESKEVSLGAPNPLVDYGSGMMMSQISGPSDVHGIKIHFSQISMSCGMVMILDSQNNTVETITSSTTNHWSPIVLGSSAMVIYYDATGTCPTPTVTMTESVAVYQGSHEYVRIGYPGQYQEPETGLIENWWRYYEPETGRYLGEELLFQDPEKVQTHFYSGYSPNIYGYSINIPTWIIDPSGLDACYVHYDGYQIQLPYVDIKLPLGHAGALVYNPKTGRTWYYEYGRYNGDFGIVKWRKGIPNLKIGKNGEPTQESFEVLKNYLSRKYGKNNKITMECSKESDFEKANKFARDRMNDKNRKPYSWSPFSQNHCKTFAREVIEAGKK